MKLIIKKPVSWFGPYQLAEKLLFWREKESDGHGHVQPKGSDQLGKWLAEKKDGTPSKLHDLMSWIFVKKIEREPVELTIEEHDTWNLDYTLASVIVPLLKTLKEKQQSYAIIDVEDGPAYLIDLPKDSEEVLEQKRKDRWNWVLEQMIQAFEHSLPEKIHWSENYWIKGADGSQTYDAAGYELHYQTIQRGRMLFAKYFDHLWD